MCIYFIDFTKFCCFIFQKAHGIVEAKKLIRFTRLMTADEAQLFYSSLENVNEMRFQVNKLIFYRAQHGICCSKSLSFYETIRSKRTPKDERQDLRSVILPEYAKKKKQPKEIFHLPK